MKASALFPLPLWSRTFPICQEGNTIQHYRIASIYTIEKVKTVTHKKYIHMSKFSYFAFRGYDGATSIWPTSYLGCQIIQWNKIQMKKNSLRSANVGREVNVFRGCVFILPYFCSQEVVGFLDLIWALGTTCVCHTLPWLNSDYHTWESCPNSLIGH